MRISCIILLLASRLFAQTPINGSPINGIVYANQYSSLQAAIAAANGGTVILSPGTYVLSGVAGTYQTNIVGAGSIQTTITVQTGGSSSQFLLDGMLNRNNTTQVPLHNPSNFTLSGVTVDCANRGFSGVRGYYAQMSFRDVRVTNCYDGFNFIEPYMSNFSQLTSFNNSHNGFVWMNEPHEPVESMTSLNIVNVWANNNGNDGIQIGPADDTTISNSFAQMSGVNNWNFIGAANGATAAVSITCISCDAEGTGVPFNLYAQRNIVFISPLVTNPPSTEDFMVMNNVTGTILNWNQPGTPGPGHYFINYSNNDSGVSRPVQLVASEISVSDPLYFSTLYSSLNGGSYLNQFGDAGIQALSFSFNGATALTGQSGTGTKVLTDGGPTVNSPRIMGALCTSNSSACQFKNTPLCTTSAKQLSTCSVSVKWPTAFPDSNYLVICQTKWTNVVASVGNYGMQTPNGVLVNVINMSSSALNAGTLDCIAAHP